MFNRITLVLITLLASIAIFACTRTESAATDDDAPKTVRGRLMFSKSLHALRIGDRYAYRDVTQSLFFDGKPWAPDKDKDLADRLGGCDTSPNPNIEMLRCSGGFSEGYRYTYLFRVKNNRPEIKKIDDDCGKGPMWIDTDGRWMLLQKCYYNVETDEKIPVKGMPFTEDDMGSVPIQYVLAVSPDKKTVIGSYDLAAEEKNGEKLVKLFNIDTVAGTREIRFASLTKYPWLKDHEQPSVDIVPPPAAAKNFVWKKDAAGKDILVTPQLGGVFVRPTPKP